MASPIIDYIRQTLAAGHAEADIRAQLLASGWQVTAIDEAFQQVQPAPASTKRPPKKSARSVITKRPKRRSAGLLKGHWRLAVGLSVLAVLVASGTYLSLRHKAVPTAAAQATHVLSDSEKRRNDVMAVAGAVGQFATANSALPTRTLAAGSNGLQLCGPSCDPANPVVLQLTLYQPANVRIVPFVTGLAAPGTQTILVVPAGKCDGSTLAAQAATKDRAAVLLYSELVHDVLTTHCVTL